VNPDIDARTHPYIATGLAEHKFGIALHDAEAAYLRAASLRNLEVIGIAAHVGSQILDTDVFARTAACIAELGARLAARGIVLEHVDLGGGLGIGYGRDAAPSPDEYVRALLAPLADTPWRVLIEPGRALVGAAGVLLCRVTYLKAQARSASRSSTPA
jgi:diaminopimelate decarboxylase